MQAEIWYNEGEKMAKKMDDIWSVESLLKRRKQYLGLLRNFRLIDDVFMRVALRDTKCVEYVLNIILDNDIPIVNNEVEAVLPNLHGRGARIDVSAIDSYGRVAGLEIQRANSGAQPKRARRNLSLLDANFPDSGKYGKNLPETFVIFITEEDTLHGGLPIYHVERVITETGELFNDKAHIIYVNSTIQNETTKLGRLMHDFRVKSADEMHPSVLAERVRDLKETKGGQYTMCKALEDLFRENFNQFRAETLEEGREEGIEQGIKQGRALERVQTILTLAKTMSAEKIAEALELSPDFVREVLA